MPLAHPFSTRPHLSRRHLFVASALTVAGVAIAAPASAADDFSLEFRTAREDLKGFDLSAITPTQDTNARLIVAVGRAHGIADHGIRAALAAAIVESWLYNRYAITDGTSGGLFQQQTSVGWGTSEQVRDKLMATRAFYGVSDHTPNPGLQDYAPRYLDLSIGDAAQKVQRSAYPDRYQTHADDADALLARHADVAPFNG